MDMIANDTRELKSKSMPKRKFIILSKFLTAQALFYAYTVAVLVLAQIIVNYFQLLIPRKKCYFEIAFIIGRSFHNQGYDNVTR
eukprot:snap_masked-scaffold_61-processed-gene-0.56-mRNA-1 protein AED:1.00 eAED:1.00 QI:0/0/0/0/1/1/2/0/83